MSWFQRLTIAALLITLCPTVHAQVGDPMLPDPKLTPGKIARKDKDRLGVTEEMERRVFSRYRIEWRRRAEFKVDHLIPIELGGADAVDNLWPQSLSTRPYNAHRKEVLTRQSLGPRRHRANDPRAGAEGNQRRLDFLLCGISGNRLPALSSREARRVDSLRREFSVDRDQRIFATVLRPVIARKTGLRPNHDMTRPAVAKNQHRTYRRREFVAHRHALETIVSHQFFARLRCVMGFRIGIDNAGREERFLHVTPAARLGTRVGAFLRDGRRAPQPRIEA